MDRISKIMIEIKYQQSEISTLLVALKENSENPAVFSKIRAKILSLHFGILKDVDLEKLLDQQSQIEAKVAATGFNRASLDFLLGELTISANLLNSVIRRLEE
jgi:hypothetical protein